MPFILTPSTLINMCVCVCVCVYVCVCVSHPCVEQCVEDVVRGGLGSPLQHLRQEEELKE